MKCSWDFGSLSLQHITVVLYELQNDGMGIFPVSILSPPAHIVTQQLMEISHALIHAH